MIAPNELLERLRWRYATKLFDPSRTIPPDLWDTLIEALVLTPSSFGLQPWQFLHIETPALRAELRAASWNQSQVTDASHFLVFASHTATSAAEVDGWIGQLATATAVEPESLSKYRQVMIRFLEAMTPTELTAWAKHQSYIALGQLMSCAAMLGVDTCPMEGFDNAAYDRILNLESQGFTAVVACALGYRAAEDKYATQPKARFPRDQVVVKR